jgi:very-short-patch-repair endonuclease
MRRRATAEEERLWQALRRPVWQGPPCRRQQVIDGFIGDYCCYQARLIVEVDVRERLPETLQRIREHCRC